jgi:uncharacterized protein
MAGRCGAGVAMRDGWLRRIIKRIARGRYEVDLAITRRILQLSGGPRYRLTGSCNGCGKCCEQPTIPVTRAVFHLRSLRWLALTWHRLVNGFVLVGEDRRLRLFAFRCTHYDPVTRQCDSYESRPALCRDYPLNLTYAAIPELFPECSYRVVYQNAAGMRQALEATALSPRQVEELAKKLHLEE